MYSVCSAEPEDSLFLLLLRKFSDNLCRFRNFPTFDFSRRYTPQIPSQSTPDPTYTSSLDTPNTHQDSSSNEEIQGVTPKDPLYRIPNTEVD